MCLPQAIKSFQNYRGVATTFYPTLVLKYIIHEQNMMLWNGCIWLRTQVSGQLLWLRQSTVSSIKGGKVSGHQDYCQRLKDLLCGVRAMLKCGSYAEGERKFSLIQNVENGSRPTYLPIQYIPRFFPSGGGRSGRDVNFTPSSSSAEVKNEWSCTSIPSICCRGLL